jgi:carbohydrate-selective porin OprB
VSGRDPVRGGADADRVLRSAPGRAHAPERAVEVYYALNLTKAVTMTFDYQHIENPAYNRDRGPADFFAR